MNLLKEFSADTSIHGMRHLARSNPWRRVIWCIIMSTSTVLFCLQISMKFKVYWSNFYLTNIDIIYPDQQGLALPAIALCNINQFKISYMTKSLYELISETYIGAHKDFNRTTNLQYYKDEIKRMNLNTSLEFLIAASPKQEDMIITCHWAHEQLCEKPKLLMTDYGICYGFNTEQVAQKMATTAGMRDNLFVLINAETYEQMANDADSSGVKVVFYDQQNVPFIQQKAIDLPTGYTTSISLNKRIQKQLPKGKVRTCTNSMDLNHFSGEPYSIEKCQMNTVINKITSKCNCQPFNAPQNTTSSYAACSVYEHFNCVVAHMHIRNDDLRCPDSCNVTTFNPTLSFSSFDSYTFSNKYNEWIKTTKPKFFNAMEARSRIQDEWVSQLEALFKSMDLLKTTLTHEKLIPTFDKFEGTYNRLINEVQCYKNFTENYKEFIVEAKYEFAPLDQEHVPILPHHVYYRVLHPDAHIKDIILHVDDMINMESFDKDDRKLSNTLEILQRLVKLFQAQHFTQELKDDKVGKSFQEIYNAVERYRNHEMTKYELAVVFDENKQNTDLFQDVIESTAANLMHIVRKLSEPKTVSDLEQLEKIMSDSDALELLTEGLYSKERDFKDEKCYKHVKKVAKKLVHEYSSKKELYKLPNYLRSDDNFSKFGLCRSEIPFSMHQLLNDSINCLSGELRLKSQQLYQQVVLTGTSSKKTFDGIFSYLNNYKQMLDDETYIFQSNMLAMSVYYNTLNVEQLSQHLAYDIIDFLCDIGGSLGLFLGASILTLFETIDFFTLRQVAEVAEKKHEVKKKSGTQETYKP